jgi:hypothetical protein
MANAPIHQIWMSSMLAIIRPMSMQIGSRGRGSTGSHIP